MRKSEPQSRCRVIEFVAPHVSNRANPRSTPRAWKAAVLRPVWNECKSSARAEARTRTNVGQSVWPQPYRARKAVTARKASIALPCGLRLELGMRSFGSSTATPNPSVEGTAQKAAPFVRPSPRTLGVAKDQMCNSEPMSRLQAVEFNTPHANARANLLLVSGTWEATAL
jgi:hypothetical protein